MKKAIRFTMLSVIVVAVVFASLRFIKYRQPKIDTSCLTVTFFDVGQADSSLLTFPDGKSVLIDCGLSTTAEGLVKKIKALGVKSIDTLVITHPHEDHIGGIEKITSYLDVDTILLPTVNGERDITLSAGEWSEYTKDSFVVFADGGKTVMNGENYSVKVLSPLETEVFSDMNDCSVVLKVEYYGTSLLFTGDAGIAAETALIGNNTDLSADIIKIGHHGAKTSASSEFLEKVSPSVAVISVGEGNSYGHPNGDTLERLNTIGAKIMRTDLSGDITVKCYEKGFNTYAKRN